MAAAARSMGHLAEESMKQQFHNVTIPTQGGATLSRSSRWRREAFLCDKSGISDGLLTCFIRHTSASLLIQENADPNVQKDLIVAGRFARLAPEDFPLLQA